jgi:hypothetical protein
MHSFFCIFWYTPKRNSKIDSIDKDPHETVKSLSLTYSFLTEAPSLTVEMHSNSVQSEPLAGSDLLVGAIGRGHDSTLISENRATPETASHDCPREDHENRTIRVKIMSISSQHFRFFPPLSLTIMKFLKLSLLAPAMFAVILSVPGTRSTPVPSKEVSHPVIQTNVLGFKHPRKQPTLLVPSQR